MFTNILTSTQQDCSEEGQMKSDQEDSDHSREETQIQDENVSIYMYSSSILVHSAHNITVTG